MPSTSAVVHAGSRFEVVLEPLAYGARVTVRDDAHCAPAMRDSNPLATSGHGLHVIAAVASAWGVEPTTGGKSVWAELRG